MENKYSNDSAITLTIEDGDNKIELNMYLDVFEGILLQLKNNGVVDVKGRDDFFIGYTKDLANIGLMDSPKSTMYPYCNYFPLKDEEMLVELLEAYDQSKDEIFSE